MPKHCHYDECTTRPSYGVDDGSRKAEFCSQHAKAGMVDVVNRRCAHQGCTKGPSYGKDDGCRKVEFCSAHAMAEMVDVRSRRCAHQDCTKGPSYGKDDGNRKAEFCSQHAKAGMVDVKHKRSALEAGVVGRKRTLSRSRNAEVGINKHPRSGRDSAGRAECQPGDSAVGIDASLAAAGAANSKKRHRPAAQGRVSSSGGGGTRGKKRAVAVRVKTEGDSNGPAGDAGGASSQPCRSRGEGGLRLRPTRPTRAERDGEDTAVKIEAKPSAGHP